jgi:ribosomal protein L40E
VKGDIETRLERGIEAVKAGENRRARDILIHVIELDQYNEHAWLWLSATVESAANRVVCLENVLFINPRNTLAAASLQCLHQEELSPFTPAATLPRLAVSQALDEGTDEEEEDAWEWAGEEKQSEVEEGWGWDSSTSAVPRQPGGQVCPRCDYRNPSWVHVCDRCGADLRPVDLHEALGSGAEPRGKSVLTLLAAWGGAFTFNRLLAFLPEVELASWGRNLAALVMAVLFALAWRTVMTVALRLVAGAGGLDRRLIELALHSAAQTLPPILRLTLAYVPTALLTWLGARLVGGRQGLKVHAHLTAVAYSAWLALIALLAPLIPLAPYLPSGNDQLVPLFELPPTLVSLVLGLIGVTWLTQALRTAHRLSAMHAILAVLLSIALGAALLFGLHLLPDEWLARLVEISSASLPLWTD